MADISHFPLDSRNGTGVPANRIRYAGSRSDTAVHFHFLSLADDGGDIWGVAVYHEDSVAQAFTVSGGKLDSMIVELVRDGFNSLEERCGGAVLEVSMQPPRPFLTLVEDC